MLAGQGPLCSSTIISNTLLCTSTHAGLYSVPERNCQLAATTAMMISTLPAADNRHRRLRRRFEIHAAQAPTLGSNVMEYGRLELGKNLTDEDLDGRSGKRRASIEKPLTPEEMQREQVTAGRRCRANDVAVLKSSNSAMSRPCNSDMENLPAWRFSNVSDRPCLWHAWHLSQLS